MPPKPRKLSQFAMSQPQGPTGTPMQAMQNRAIAPSTMTPNPNPPQMNQMQQMQQSRGLGPKRRRPGMGPPGISSAAMGAYGRGAF